MAVHPDYQRQGFGNMLMRHLEEESRQNGAKKIILHARESALNFYKKNGYKQIEQSYLLFGSIQHYLMEKCFRKRILFICTGNTCRSQMAEGLARHFGGGHLDIASAGSHPSKKVNSKAVQVMKEMGIDISGQIPKSIKQYKNYHQDIVITLCDRAQKYCPVFSSDTEILHWGIQDPYDATGTKDEMLQVYRATRDEILQKIKTKFAIHS